MVKQFDIEFDGYDYVVSSRGQIVAAFASLDEAYEAKREFEEKSPCDHKHKVPPAMRLAKSFLYGKA